MQHFYSPETYLHLGAPHLFVNQRKGAPICSSLGSLGMGHAGEQWWELRISEEGSQVPGKGGHVVGIFHCDLMTCWSVNVLHLSLLIPAGLPGTVFKNYLLNFLFWNNVRLTKRVVKIAQNSPNAYISLVWLSKPGDWPWCNIINSFPDLIHISPMSHQYPSSGPGCSPGSHGVSSCPVSSASSNLGLFLHHSLSFMTLTPLASSFVGRGFVSYVFMIRVMVCISDKMLCVPSVHGIERSVRPMCLSLYWWS